jgi:hypothetical protein
MQYLTELFLNLLWSKFFLGIIISVCESVRVYHPVFLVSSFQISSHISELQKQS